MIHYSQHHTYAPTATCKRDENSTEIKSTRCAEFSLPAFSFLCDMVAVADYVLSILPGLKLKTLLTFAGRERCLIDQIHHNHHCCFRKPCQERGQGHSLGKIRLKIVSK
ncbi:hypothetical protein BaRGS_00004231 [Batillaria attramentaria]|uniref:Uncharacterized protein n=1 Tax=Batillaria attramentaria TaxID=370345 RepID=A0ABD0LXI7_9CAEN